jgi:hypothetical protein
MQSDTAVTPCRNFLEYKIPTADWCLLLLYFCCASISHASSGRATPTRKMAARVLQTLKEEITCPLCLEVFNRPKKLPCDHVYCQECLSQLVRRRGIDTNIACPECRSPAAVVSEDCSNFPTAFHLNRLIEMYENGVREVNENVVESRRSAEPGNCPTHPAQPLSLYCETCEKLVCRECIMFSCAKSQHSYGYTGDVLEKHKSALDTSLFTVKERQRCMNEMLDCTKEFAKDIDEQEEKVIGEVDAAFVQLFSIIQEEKAMLTTRLKKGFQEARTQNSLRKAEVVAVSAKLEKVMHHGNPGQDDYSFFAELKTRKAVINEAINAALAIEHPDPVKLPGTGFSAIKPEQLRELCKRNIFTSDKLECHFEGAFGWGSVPLRSQSHVVLRTSNHCPELEAHLHCLYSKEMFPVQIRKDHGLRYMLAFTPQQRGRHELLIQCNGKHVSVSPAPLDVVDNPINLNVCMAMGFGQPVGIKCVGEFVCVSDLDSGLTFLRSRTLDKVSTIKMKSVWEVYVDSEFKRIYGTDVNRNTIKMMNMDGKVLKTVGGRGSSPGKFNMPNGIRSCKGIIYVCDTMNDRIQVFDRNLNFLRVMNLPLSTPDDFDFDRDGNLFIANQGAHNIVVSNPNGVYLHTIGTAGHRPGQLSNPISVAVHGGLVYVTDNGNGRISVFNTTGQFVCIFGEHTLQKPECIVVDKDGYVYVTDSRSRVLVF